MKSPIVTIFIVISACMLAFSSARAEGNAVFVAKNIELAEAILMPKPNAPKISRDPFSPLSGAFYKSGSGGSGELRLVGVLYKDNAPLALMETSDGSGVFKKGDKIGDYIVKKIYSKRVVLQKGKKHFIFELGEENEK